ncbi:peptide chain release factor 2 [Patescibacteria group bacterium]|nr:peptide chain release factor 2 [Patescibacteria group bacterium]MBU1705261.1 peptide chain release factor 2 [Patescibacteria group bacterium]
MKELIRQIQDLQEKAGRTWGLLDLDTAKVQLKSLEEQMGNPDFWRDQEKAKEVGKQAADLKSELAVWESFNQEADDLLEMAQLADQEGDESLSGEIGSKLEKLEAAFSKMEFAILLAGPYDKANAIVAIHAGSGGTEAQDWSEMLLRMFVRFAEQKGFEVQIVDEARGEEAGFKRVMFRVIGRYAYGYLKSEHGVHRLVRISPFDAEKMRHTSFALVEVLPEFENLEELEINPDDLRIDTFMAGGKGGQSVNTTYSAVRIVHLPTKITVSCQNERSQKQNKETALKILKAKLHQLQLAEEAAKKKELRGDYQSAEWGNQIRSYVLQPYKMVKDHRTEYETSDAAGVLAGDLESFMEAYLRWELAQSDRFAQANQE